MKFDELYGGARKAAQTAAKKIGSTADLASLHLKLSAAQSRLEEAYTLLGRTSYLHFTGEADLSEKVARAVENVDAARQEVKQIKQKIEQAKERAAAKKECRTDCGETGE